MSEMKADPEQPDERNPLRTLRARGDGDERWVRITEIVGTAWEMTASQRGSYVKACCKDDVSMRQEVEKLLQQLSDSTGLLESISPAVAGLGSPDIPPGTLLARYRIQEKIGEGGMGVVYCAIDERLHRRVALKVLRFPLLDAQYRSRLLREAQMAAALSHPNIVTVYDTGSSGDIDFIVMEYVSGVPLNKVISRGPIPLETAVRYAEQIAGALAKAHAAGIVHRDLKPGNVILADDGNIKVLDFGVAKRVDKLLDNALLSPNVPSADNGQSNFDHTMQGVVFGTIAYMSPEQARGQRVDERSDIFSFGAILFELVSGRQAFRGTSQTQILNAILSGPTPSLRKASGRISRELDSLLGQCLRKEPASRPPAAGVVAALQALKQERRTRIRVASAAALAACLLALALILKYPSHPSDAPLLAHPLTSDPGDETSCSFSPDGRQIVFAWRREQENYYSLYTMPSTGGAARRLTTDDSSDDFSPAWSPDGRQIAFLRGRAGEPGSIMVVAASGASSRTLAALTTTPWIGIRGLDWSSDNQKLAFADQDRNGGWSLYILAPATGERHMLVQAPRGANYVQPAFSPDGRQLAFTEDRNGVSRLRLLPLTAKGEPRGASWPVRLRGFENAYSNNPMWRDEGTKLLFSSNRSGSGDRLWSADVTASERTEVVPEMAGALGEGALLPAISRTGHYLAFTRFSEDNDIWRVNLSAPGAGQSEKFISSTRQERFPQYSPDGRQVAFESDRSGFPEIWIAKADGSGAFALTNFAGPVTGSPSWSPDGSQIAFDSRAGGEPAVFVMRAAAGAKPRRLTSGGGFVPCWSTDGRSIFFTSDRSGNNAIWRIAAEGGQPAEQITTGFAFGPQASPDGRYLYFMTGRTWGSEVHRLELSTRQETKVIPSAIDRSFSPTNRGVYYLHKLGTYYEVLRFWNGVTHQDVAICRIAGRVAGGLSVSQDNRFALITKDDGGGMDLMLVKDFR